MVSFFRPLLPALLLLVLLSNQLGGNALDNHLFTVHKGDELVFAADPDKFVSTGLQEYLVHPYRILEFSVAFQGDGNRLRIYAIQPMDLDEYGSISDPRLRSGHDRAGTSARAVAGDVAIPSPSSGQVVKNYPDTTHAGTVEFLVQNFEEIRRINQQMERSFRNNDSLREALINTRIEL